MTAQTNGIHGKERPLAPPKRRGSNYAQPCALMPTLKSLRSTVAKIMQHVGH
jgi:hypothetical protein